MESGEVMDKVGKVKKKKNYRYTSLVEKDDITFLMNRAHKDS